MLKETPIELAVEQPMRALDRAELERELADGYTANAEQAISACEEFADVDGDVIS